MILLFYSSNFQVNFIKIKFNMHSKNKIRLKLFFY